jgi:hypothetical protein
MDPEYISIEALLSFYEIETKKKLFKLRDQGFFEAALNYIEYIKLLGEIDKNSNVESHPTEHFILSKHILDEWFDESQEIQSILKRISHKKARFIKENFYILPFDSVIGIFIVYMGVNDEVESTSFVYKFKNYPVESDEYIGIAKKGIIDSLTKVITDRVLPKTEGEE